MWIRAVVAQLRHILMRPLGLAVMFAQKTNTPVPGMHLNRHFQEKQQQFHNDLEPLLSSVHAFWWNETSAPSIVCKAQSNWQQFILSKVVLGTHHPIAVQPLIEFAPIHWLQNTDTCPDLLFVLFEWLAEVDRYKSANISITIQRVFRLDVLLSVLETTNIRIKWLINLPRSYYHVV